MVQNIQVLLFFMFILSTAALTDGNQEKYFQEMKILNRYSRSTVYTMISVRVRSTYGCGFAWWKECSRYHLEYRSVRKDLTASCSSIPGSKFCYPGECPGGTSSCTCSSGFEGYNCLMIKDPPTINACKVFLEITPGNGAEKSCTDDSSTEIFINDRSMRSLRLEWTVEFKSGYMPSKPSYVRSIDVGLIHAHSEIVIEHIDGTADNNSYSCGSSWSNDKPKNGSQNCSQTKYINVRDGDRILAGVSAGNGGLVELNEDKTTQYDRTEYFQGRTNSLEFYVFTYDIAPPYSHDDDVLDVGDAYTKQSDVTVKWFGWTDDVSGIKLFEIDLLTTFSAGGTLNCSHQDENTRKCDNDATAPSCSFTFTNSGVYCVLLTVEDYAENYIYAMRYLLFDHDSTMEIHDNYPLWVSSAAADTNYEWQTNGQNVINVKWHGHFQNKNHSLGGYLNPINEYYLDVPDDYDKLIGQPPLYRSRAGISNTNGTVKFFIAHGKDSQGGKTLQNASPNWQPKGDLSEDFDIIITIKDGDTVKMWVKAVDVMDNEIQDSVMVHIDSSEPVINDIYLTKDGVNDLVVHNSKELSKMCVVFETFDEHSGLKQIEWKLYDEIENVVHGSGHVAVRQGDHANCGQSQCECIPNGDCFVMEYDITLSNVAPLPGNGKHDHDYIIAITVTNHALLNTTRTLKITVDTSPPLDGHVIDNRPGETDLDYQQGLQIFASWDGFFDKESGVMKYVYYFGRECLNSTSGISFPIQEPFISTILTSAQWMAPGPGKYHCTVIAYNRALDPSNPVCSDGVTIDDTEPIVEEIIIDDVFVKPGLVKDVTGTVWFIDEHRYRKRLLNQSDICKNIASFESSVSLYPMQRISNSTEVLMQDGECTSYGGRTGHVFVRKENLIAMRWHGGDEESGIFDYEVGIGSTLSGLDPDILPYTSTKRHSEFLTYHPNLREGLEFYISIKAINRAGLTNIQTIGPFLVEVSAPIFHGNITVTTEDEQDKDFLVARWSPDSFYDDDQMDQPLIYEVATGDTKGGSTLMPFVSISDLQNNLCQATTPPSCAAIPTDHLSWGLHGEHVYFVSIKATNIAGLSVVGTSSPYHHVVRLPIKGNVYETVSKVDANPFGVQEDIDFQVDDSSLHCRWSGFSHRHQIINYELALGTRSDLDDIISFHIVGQDISSYTFTGLSLVKYQTYYVLVRASTEVGSVTSSSDGVTILSNGDVLTDSRVYDGPGCKQNKDAMTEDGLHHDYDRRDHLCVDDVDFQSSTSTVYTHWMIPDQMADYVSFVEWSLQRKQNINSSSILWDSVTPYIRLQNAKFFHQADILLLPGQKYRALVKFCFSGGCFEAVASNGFWVTPYPPLPKGIQQITYSNLTDTISITWNTFKQGELQDDSGQPIDYYEWSLAVTSIERDEVHNDVLIPWQRINVTLHSGQISQVVRTPFPIDFTQCVRLGLRGYNKAGLHTTIYEDINDCRSLNSGAVHTNKVIDAVGDYDDATDDVSDVYIDDNDIWKESDREYTRSHHTLSAVWPTLEHSHFCWKVISDQTQDYQPYRRQSNGLDFDTYECSSPEILACGFSDVNFVNVGNLDLKHGWRYHICIHANETTKVYGNIETLLPEVSECSNGIVADHTPPEAGQTWIGWHKQLYQASATDFTVSWNGFYDVEEHGKTSHSSGIRRYEVAIGTSPGGVDVQDFQSVGVTNWVNVYNLSLSGGQTYYATVRAIDFVGLFTDVVSDGVTVDTSPPVKSEMGIDAGGPFITSTSFIEAKWKNVFSDEESGIMYYEWCIGSKPGYANVFPCTSTTQEQITLQGEENDLNLLEGHVYYVMVKAYNGAGLSTYAISWALLVDASPPGRGYVHDGCNHGKDDDYQLRLDKLCAHWYGFQDPHSGLTGYSWSVGSCPGCDDVLAEESVGLLTAMNVSYLWLEPGTRYYTTVTACNAARLCTSVTSDGIIPDNSPPVAGNVYDGIYDGDLQFQSSRTTLAAHWYNFHDPHTQLSHYEVRAGTTVGGEDILANTKLHLTEKIFTSKLLQPIPLHSRVYVTVRAYNKGGLFVEKSSNGIIVDESPPVIVQPAEIEESLGSIFPGTQVWHSTLHVSWEFQDNESSIESHLLSVFTHHQSEDPTPPVKIPGSFRRYTFTNLSLHDGDTYYVSVIACNAAKLCISSDTGDVKVDSSPPTVGTFAVDTDHAAELPRHRQGSMTYHQSQGGTSARVKLAWLGFSDIHSGIIHYYIAVGSSFGLWDLSQDQAIEIGYQDGEPHFDEGVIQTASVDVIRDLIPEEQIYCTLWGVNGVGVRSYEAHETFVVIQTNEVGGVLSLLRRCDTQTCQGDCTCAPQNQVCQRTPELCENKSGNFQYQQVDVYDVIDYRSTEINNLYEDMEFSPSRCTLAARWRAVSGGIPVQRYEWSVGSKGEDVGAGLLNPAFDRLWHDAGNTTFALFTKKDGPLDSKVYYVFYVKAWYDEQTYAIFISNGVKPDFTPPRISSSRKVKDIIDTSNLVDVDFSTNTDRLGMSWKNVFLNNDSSVNHFMVSVSTRPGGEDVRPYGLSTDDSVVMLTSMNLQIGVIYFTNVMAVNHVGLASIASSDGVMIDDSPPEVGVVYDGLGLQDADYQNSTTLVSASWHGFSDLESSIHHYVWCVGRTPGTEDILPCHSVGLHLSMVESLTVPLTSGERYFSKVTAVDGAGLISSPAISDGIFVDTSPPAARSTYIEQQNFIDNPYFEDIMEEAPNGVNSTVNCTDVRSGTCSPRGWQVEGIVHVQKSEKTVGQSGNAYLILHGSVSQNIETVNGDAYKLSFYVSHTSRSTTPLLSQEGYVDIPGMHRVFHLFQRGGNHGDSDILAWYEHVYYFTAVSTSSTVRIGSLGERNAIALDNVQVMRVIKGTDTDDIITQYSTALPVDVRTDGESFAVLANWEMVDLESPIIEYLWAIGTVKGGTQIQTFKSLGRSTHAIADDVFLTHGLPVYVTVVARNAADLQTAIYSEPVLIDLTPPVICCVLDGTDNNEDAEYQTSSVISVQWNVSDHESGVAYCEWAVGLSPGSQVLQPFTRSESFSFSQSNFTNRLEHGQTVYSTVRCHNGAGLVTQETSNGVVIIKKAPTTSDATLRVVTTSPTIFEPRHNHQSNTDSIAIVWDGFMDITGISHYECNIVQGGNSSEWRSVGLNGETAALLTGLDLNKTQPLTYQILVRAINHGGFTSDTLATVVNIDSSAPVLTGINIERTWLSEDTVLLSWNGAFSSSSSLIYELTVTTLYSGNTIIQWLETMDTSYTLNGIDPSLEFYVIITAANEAGLTNSINGVFSYSV